MSPQEILKAVEKLRVLVVGDVMLDHYVWGEVQRISPEAPVPVIQATRDSYAGGGAANVALNLAAIGARTSILGCIGDDEAGQRLRRILDDQRIEWIEYPTDVTPSTIVKTRIVARTQQVCRIDREEHRNRYRLDHIQSAMHMFDLAIENSDAVIVSDYAKGVVTQSLLDRILHLRREERPFTAIDTKPSRSLSLKGANLITPNRAEAIQMAGLTDSLDTDELLPEICRRIHERFSPDTLAVTLGADGMAISRNGMVETVLPTIAREVFDVSGAGDTVIATLAAALAAGVDPVRAAQFANAAAGCVVGHAGTVPVDRGELVSALNSW